jgi:hypothetical protein
LVIAAEGEEDDQAEQNGEARRDDAEDTRGAVAIGEIAALGRTPADEQNRPDRDAGRGQDDED